MKKKHIAFFIGSISSKGGTEKMTISLANQLVEEGYFVSIVSISPKKSCFFQIHNDIHVYSLLSSSSGFLLKWPFIVYSLTRIVKKEKIEILIDVDVILSLFSLPVKLFFHQLRTISWEHFNYKTNLGIRRRDYARRLSKRYANAIVTLTEQDRNFYLEDGKSKAAIYAIANFVDSPSSMKAELLNKKVISVGRFTFQKGFDILVDIWNMVKRNSVSDDWVLEIIGDGEDKNVIKDKIKKLELENSIKIIDAKENISDYYLDSSIYLMTSRFEGLPMVLLEAKSYGLPLVAFNCLTGPQDIINDNIDGYLLPMADNNLMVEKVCRLMGDANLRKKMGIEAFSNSRLFSKETIIEKWKSLFDIL